MTRTVLAAALFLLAGPVAARDVPDIAPPGPRDLTALMARLGKLPGELVKAKKTDAEVVEAMYLGTVLRLPEDREKEAALKLLAGAGDRAQRTRDLAWALVNSKEFLKLHGMDKDIPAALKVLNKLYEKWGKDDEKK